ncbi:hypothetical protein [Paraferrimonas haliotis]|uniref:hypothetical protein n=1 Tax=Paraferrimonas haliotis TaxID=2013866 RepID=UPI000BA937C0|nr:hypothetical protein [Paraferrimonas haliotis]
MAKKNKTATPTPVEQAPEVETEPTDIAPTPVVETENVETTPIETGQESVVETEPTEIGAESVIDNERERVVVLGISLVDTELGSFKPGDHYPCTAATAERLIERGHAKAHD